MFVLKIISIVLGALALAAFLILTVVRSEDPPRMILKWILTAVVLGALFFYVGPIISQNGPAAAFGVPLAGVCGLVLAIIWRRTISELAARPFMSLYDGGSAPPEPRPVYSVAQAKQKQGLYQEAVSEVRKQLAMFPNDVEGNLLLAEIQAQNLKDLEAAEITINDFCSQPGHAPKNMAFALLSMADWHLAVAADRPAARRCFERIQQLLPDTEFALGAAQRIAHLEGPEMAPLDPKLYGVKEGQRRIGLMKHSDHLKPAETDLKALAQKYVDHLVIHPLDFDIREKLAVIYADEYKRLDLALDQLEQMIATPNQPSKNIVRWLNLMADLQVRGGAELETVQHTLQRIIDRHSGSAAAEMAHNRLNLLKLEFKALEKKEAVKMGTYEQNLGLKAARPPTFKAR